MAARWKPSVTVAAIAGRRRAGDTDIDEYLLVEEETSAGLRINNPAGHLEAGESLAEAVVREVLEETATAFVPERLVGVYLARVDAATGDDDITYLRFAFAGSAGAADRRRRLDDGIVRTLWLTLDELRACRDRHRSVLVLRSIEDAAAGCAVPLERIVTDASVRRPVRRSTTR
ncbi:MAG TPA: NUDIX domain-containing protein [Caldimonas sp.]|jgi:8-oxo-dGTP pyrophosphatase MutT (NUDIX family)|nr:NUDIX domain-containing protein [Caldimonas sp.]HEX4234094.1 NUDIX domain-containing protein [Caldimonas sp.]